MASEKVTPASLTVVIITRNRVPLLTNALRSLYAEQSDLDIVVVDSSEGRDTEQMIRQSFPAVRYFRVSYTKFILSIARNFGARQTDREIISFVDDDITVDPGWLAALCGGFADPAVGAVGGRINDPEVEHHDHQRADPICRILPDGQIADNQDCDPGRVLEVDHLRGCNWALRRQVFESIGGFDESWDTYAYEEFDLALRIRKAGYKLLFVPGMSLYHHLAPRQGDVRYHKSLRRRYQHCRMIAYAYAKSRHPVLRAYLVRGNTGARAFLRKPTGHNFLFLVTGYAGKLAGLWRCLWQS